MEDKNTESTARTAESIPVSETIQETKTEPPKITPED